MLFASNCWIVVTTIQPPTEPLKKLAAIPGWRLVVVGDKKTPTDWHLDGCDYLSPEKQLELGFELAHLLPWNHYSRKNIGYLYAISQGAEWIYETDDDNEPIGRLAPLLQDAELPSILSETSSFNVYAYFGRSDLWPRGYPLERIARSSDFEILPPSPLRIGVEQGLVNGDPDVDAISRLLYGKPVEFENRESCALAKGTFCPFNSQNTFIAKDAFFSLYLPSTVNMRVSDIWRGLVAERLLWEKGLTVAFSGPNAYQERNAHSLINDFKMEMELYTESGRLIDALSSWAPSREDPFSSLIDQLIAEGFFSPRESDLARAWASDLSKALRSSEVDIPQSDKQAEASGSR